MLIKKLIMPESIVLRLLRCALKSAAQELNTAMNGNAEAVM